MSASWKGLLERVRSKKYGRRQPLILLNGLAEQAESWYRNVRFWGRYFDVHLPNMIAYDGPGLHQRIKSGEPVNIEYFVEQLHLYTQQFIQRPPYHIVSSSLGGKVAVEFAVKYPELVKRLVLICPSGMGDTERLPLMDGMQRSDHAGLIRSVFHNPRKADRGLMTYYKRRFQDRKWKLGVVRVVRGTSDHVVRPQMKKIKAPTLVLGAKEDQIVDYREGERAAMEIPDGHLLSLPNCGHAPQIEMARLVNRLVVHFLTASVPSAHPSFVKLLLNKPTRATT